MSRENHSSEYQEEQEHISNPDLFLNLGKPECDDSEGAENKSETERRVRNIDMSDIGKRSRTQKKDRENVEVKRSKKRIRKSSSNSDSEASFHETRQRRRDMAQAKRKAGDFKAKLKSRKKGKGNTVEEIKKELTDLIAQRNQKSQNKRNHFDMRSQYVPIPTIWHSRGPNQRDFSSVKGDVNEETMAMRIQTLTYKKMIEMINQNADNLISKIADLPPIYS